MSIEKFSISRDPEWYEAWPDVVRTGPERLLCIFTECTHHANRAHSRIMLTESADRGRTWSGKRQLIPDSFDSGCYFNCARISRLADRRLAVTVDRIRSGQPESDPGASSVCLLFSSDDGRTWSEPTITPLCGIVPDKLIELESGRWLLSAHCRAANGKLAQYLHYSDDGGRSWSDRITVAASAELNLCEASLVPLGGGGVAAFMRENSGLGLDCQKVLSSDGGASWGAVTAFPLPGCHRPTAGWLRDGRLLITYRFMQGGRGWLGSWTQNLFAALTDRESVLAAERSQCATRIMPVDFDRSPKSDLGYSGWVQFDDGEIYIVNYIVDDAIDRGQIRGYALHPDEFLL